MTDINIKLGYIGHDVIAICEDDEHEYAFFGFYERSEGVYRTKMSSTHGLITTGRFSNTLNTRQMVLVAMSKHIEVLREREFEEKYKDKIEAKSKAKVH